MTDRPILFSAPMVQAIMREIVAPGTGKTQTRRILKTRPDAPQTQYSIGDRLWVREQWSGEWAWHDWKPSTRVSGVYGGEVYDRKTIWYWADGNPEYGDWERPRPSIHMPRWASRITLVVTDVRVQRLQEISEADALQEGVSSGSVTDDVSGVAEGWSAKTSFKALWDSLNKDRASWDSNPWVIAVDFKPLLENIGDAPDASPTDN